MFKVFFYFILSIFKDYDLSNPFTKESAKNKIIEGILNNIINIF